MGTLYRSTYCLIFLLHYSACFQVSEHFNRLKNVVEKVGESVANFGNNLIGERCNSEWIPYNLTDLQKDLDKNLYGQPLVKRVVLAALQIHSEDSTKPLILSFHGMPGVGKTYVIEFIARRLYKRGVNSKFVHIYVGSMHFPVTREIEKYQEQIERVIEDGINDCSRSLFVFDEVHKLQPGVLNKISALIKTYRFSSNPLLKNAVFIFTSNIGSDEIIQKTQDLFRKGLGREEFQLAEFDHLLSDVAYNKVGGLQDSDLITNSFIDHYVPFLPLEKEHIVKCINAEIIKGNLHNVMITESITERVITEAVEFGPEPENLFSNNGCKRISQKLHMLLTGERLKSQNKLIGDL